MDHSKVTEDVFRVSVNAAPNSLLFESMWPIPEGVSMNSYIVKGEKTAIIDGVCGWDGVPEALFSMLKEMGITPDDLDYVIVNHMEPDHSEWMTKLMEIRPGIAVYTTEKAKVMLKEFFGIEENVHTVKTGDTLDIGNGHVLLFGETPNVHWPETMFTFDTKSGTLFPCDAFGSFKSVPDAPYDDSMTKAEIDSFELETLRYYSNIIGAFSASVQKAIKKYDELDIKTIAPGHGLVWRKNWKKIYDDYVRYASYAKGPAKEEITFIWASMYGNTGEAVQAALDELKKLGVTVHEHRVPDSDVSFILRDAWKSSGLVIAVPTYEYKLFPPMAAVVDELAKKKLKNRKVFHFGSYGWKTGTQDELNEINERHNAKWDYLEPVNFLCKPDEAALKLIRERLRDLVSAVKEWCKAS